VKYKMAEKYTPFRKENIIPAISGALLGCGIAAEKLSPGSAAPLISNILSNPLFATGAGVGLLGAFRASYEAGKVSAQQEKS
jgi:hypothetical protein